jgi:hypothetical protein
MAQHLIQGFDLIRIAFQKHFAPTGHDTRVELVPKNAEIGVVLSEEMQRREIAEVDAARRLFRKLVQSNSFTRVVRALPGALGRLLHDRQLPGWIPVPLRKNLQSISRAESRRETATKPWPA